ncbi:VapE domain-containing protein [Cupriavidus sp. TMH.W2]|uniref:VapE domain-containing protein n=1 Tax=Cupriavidus sp. TMH.W2 TaxID=3434465 RepID=UPI003D78498D
MENSAMKNQSGPSEDRNDLELGGESPAALDDAAQQEKRRKTDEEFFAFMDSKSAAPTQGEPAAGGETIHLFSDPDVEIRAYFCDPKDAPEEWFDKEITDETVARAIWAAFIDQKHKWHQQAWQSWSHHVEKSLRERIEREAAAASVAAIKRDRKADLAELIEKYPDIVRRAKSLRGQIDFPDIKVKTGKNGGKYISTGAGDVNRMAVFDQLFGESLEVNTNRPYLDLFGMTINWIDGKPLEDLEQVSTVLADALVAAGMNDQNFAPVGKAFMTWARRASYDSVKTRMLRMVTEEQPWDGVERVDDAFVAILGTQNTPLMRHISRYFFASIYMRIIKPGANAQHMLFFVGRQGGGKNLFLDTINGTVMGDKDLIAVSGSLDGQKNDLLRDVTSRSIFLLFNERAGQTRADTNKLKEFLNKNSDVMHWKYGHQFTQQRRWTPVMDGNGIEGMYRDESGERRIVPVIVGQLPDDENGLNWSGRDDPTDTSFSVDVELLERVLWQLFAEVHEWIEREGEDAYRKHVGESIDMVLKYNNDQQQAGVGLIDDGSVRDHFGESLTATQFVYKSGGIANNVKPPHKPARGNHPDCVMVYFPDFKRKFIEKSGNDNKTIVKTALKNLSAFGMKHESLEGTFTDKKRALVFGIGAAVAKGCYELPNVLLKLSPRVLTSLPGVMEALRESEWVRKAAESAAGSGGAAEIGDRRLSDAFARLWKSGEIGTKVAETVPSRLVKSQKTGEIRLVITTEEVQELVKKAVLGEDTAGMDKREDGGF